MNTRIWNRIQFWPVRVNFGQVLPKYRRWVFKIEKWKNSTFGCTFLFFDVQLFMFYVNGFFRF
jgi:hypothetical protein